jgi:hypothetical protein
MLEDISRIMNEDLPPLTDVVRDQMSNDQAQSYADTANAALSAIQTAISAGRSEMDTAARALAGEDVATDNMEMPCDDTDTDVDTDVDADMDTDVDAEDGDDFAMTDAEVGGDLELGRAER